MGTETILIAASLGLGAMNAVSKTMNARKQAEATVKEGEIVAKNKAIQTMARAATQKVSFLSSGLTLEGTPMSVLNSTFDTGKADVSQIVENYNTKSKNIMSQARTEALSSFVDFGLKGVTAAGGVNSLFSSGGMNNFWDQSDTLGMSKTDFGGAF